MGWSAQIGDGSIGPDAARSRGDRGAVEAEQLPIAAADHAGPDRSIKGGNLPDPDGLARAHRATTANALVFLTAESSQQKGHLDRGLDSFATLVAKRSARARDCLGEGVGGKDTEDHRPAKLQLDRLTSGGALASDKIVVARLAPDNRPEADDRVDTLIGK